MSSYFASNVGGQGGVIFLDDNTEGWYESCVFEDNTSTDEGGGVSFTDDNSILHFQS